MRASGPTPDGPRGTRRLPALVVLLVGLVVTAFFGVRWWHELQFSQRVARGEIRLEMVRGWMTLPYLAKAHGVPEDALRAAIGAPVSGHEQRSLRQWFDALGIDPAAGRRAIETAILSGRLDGSPPPLPGPRPAEPTHGASPGDAR